MRKAAKVGKGRWDGNGGWAERNGRRGDIRRAKEGSHAGSLAGAVQRSEVGILKSALHRHKEMKTGRI